MDKMLERAHSGAATIFGNQLRAGAALRLAAFLLLAAAGACSASEDRAASAMPAVAPADEIPARAKTYAYDAMRGEDVFVLKGCILCHAVNGVGGKAGPALDAPSEGRLPDGYELAARMWRGAAAMVSLQRLELGYQIDVDAQDLADLAAYLSDPEQQARLTLESLPAGYDGWFIDDRFWDAEEWSEYLERGEFPDLGEFDRQ